MSNLELAPKDIQKITEKIKERPCLGQLQVGHQLRNYQEGYDLEEVLGILSDYYLYIGIIGSRLVEKLYYPPKYLAHLFPSNDENDSEVISLSENLPQLVDNLSGDDHTVDISQFHPDPRYNVVTVSDLTYDFDLVTVPKTGSDYNVAKLIGKQSGTLFEIYRVPVHEILYRTTEKPKSIFLNSQSFSI